MLTTSNYGLKKPEGTDVVDIQNFNDNADIIDTNMKAINDNSYPTVTATGTNAYVVTTDRIKALGKGTKLTLFVSYDATGNCTLNLNSYGVKNIKDSFGNVVTNLKKDIPYNLCYNGTDFILQGKGGGGNVTPDKMLSGTTATGDSGPVTGTMPDNGAITITPGTTTKTIPKGYHDGTGYVEGASDLISSNIKAGVTIFDVPGKASVVDTADATATASSIVSAYTAYKNGSKITGTATIASLGGKRYVSGSYSHTSGTTDTIPLGFAPSVIYIVSGGTYFVITPYSNNATRLNLGDTYSSIYKSGSSLVISSAYSTNTINYQAWE